mmetsp:Transcript_11564/g.24352  ORF Transcript_11564/g.24352 Transcript_11564/m.24352 type:complete len:546 (-) Transcript_11564:16-1653(-)
MAVRSASLILLVLIALTPIVASIRIEETAFAPAESGENGVVVFSDLDDTLKCSRGKWLHGIDMNCDKSGEVYPGAIQFMLELGRGPREGEVLLPPKVVPLSARPEELTRLGILKIDVKSPLNVAFQEAGRAHNASGWGIDVEGAQYGSAWNGFKSYESGLSKKKFLGWSKFSATLNLSTIFIGDNGQGDVRAAQMMLEDQDSALLAILDEDESGTIEENEFMTHFSGCRDDRTGEILTPDALKALFEILPKRWESFKQAINLDFLLCKAHALRQSGATRILEAAFIHHVQPMPMASAKLETAPGSGRFASAEMLAMEAIFLFEHYGRAACIAYKRGFISAEGYQRVMASIQAECAFEIEHRSRLWTSSRTACRVLRPEFATDMSIRAASECQAPYEFGMDVVGRNRPAGWVSSPDVLDGLTPDAFFAYQGVWQVEHKCHDIRSAQLAQLGRAHLVIDSLESANQSAVAHGVPEFINWVLGEATVHCLSQCRRACDDTPLTALDTKFNKTYTWRRVSTGTVTKRSTCKYGQRSICRLEHQVAETPH